MYAPSIVALNIADSEAVLGFRLEYHSPSDIQTFNETLQRKYETEYVAAARAAQGVKEPQQVLQTALLRALCNPESPRMNLEEFRFIENERALVMSDAAYFLTRYYWILTDEGINMLFRFRSGQKVLFKVMSEMQARGLSIEILLAKARQLGMTTLMAGLLLLKTMFSRGVSSVMASADSDKTREMVQKIFNAYDKLPWWLRTPYTKRAESDKGYLRFGSIDSGVFFQHGEQTNPIAMGTTVVAYHLSEVSSYSDAEELIDVGLFKAVHPSPRVLGVLESTCKGKIGWWAESYWDAKMGWANGESRLMALFIPFYCGEGMYPNETENRSHPIPEGWNPEPETRRMMAESEQYVQSNPLLEQSLSKDGRKWVMRPEAAYYWEWNFKSAKRKGTEKLWYQEMPHTDLAAFQGSYDNVFGKECVAQVWSNRETRYHVYGIIGESIQPRHEPDPNEVDYDAPRVPVRWVDRRGTEYRWEFLPLFWKEPFDRLNDIRSDAKRHMGKLFVYDEAEPGYDYSEGVDTSNGMGKDGSAIAMARRARDQSEQDFQAAEWRDSNVNHVEAWAWALAISAYYSRFMEQTTRYREPYAAIEQVACVGDTCQDQMALHGYSRFHRMIRYDSMPKDMRKSKSRKRGWFTGVWSRPMLTGAFVMHVQNDWYRVNSPYTIWEMDNWEVHYTGSGKDKFEHAEETTDDGVFANALAAFCANDRKSHSDRMHSKWHGGGDRGKPRLDIAPIGTGTKFHA